MTRSLTISGLVLALSLAGGCAVAQSPPPETIAGISTIVREGAGRRGDPPILELTVEAPAGSVLEVTTLQGELIGYLTRYGDGGSSTELMSLPTSLRNRLLRDVVVRPVRGATTAEVEVRSATLLTPSRD